MSTTRRLAVLVLLAALVPLAATMPADAAAPRTATVVKVVDGDTVRISVGGRVGTVDLVGVRAPTGSACFARSATRTLRRLLPLRTRITVTDETRVSGRGRYVTRRGRLVNTEMLRRGAARLGRLTRVRRASALRAAERSARTARRGLHRSCRAAAPAPAPAPTDPAPPPGAPPAEADGPAAQQRAVRAALEGNDLREVFSDTNSSTENITRFCADGRSQRQEQVIFRNSPDQSLFSSEAGSWAVTNTARQPDGSLVAEVLVRFDKASFETRTLIVNLGTDGVLRIPGRAVQTTVATQPCPAAVPDGVLDNDSPGAREAFLAALTGMRLSAAGRDTDLCPGRMVRREGGQVVADGAPVVEWAVGDPTGRIGLLRVEDATRGTSRRILVALPADAAAPTQLGELGRGDAAPTPATRGAAAC